MAKIGEILVQKGLITPQQLETALKESKGKREIIGKTLIRLGLINESVFLEVLGDQLGLTFYPTLKDIIIPQKVIETVPVKFVSHYKFMPIKADGKSITIAVSDPMAIWSMEDLKLHLNCDIDRILATEEEIMIAIRKYYGFGAATVDRIIAEDATVKKEINFKSEEVEDMDKGSATVSVIKLVNQILTEAISSRATDVHVEPYRGKVRMRYRIDGILYDMNMPGETKYLLSAIISRLKILSNLNVVEKRLPQDGRAIVKISGQQVDLRISIIPCLYGESVVIRILPIQFIFDLEKLGFLPEDLAVVEKIITKPHGIVFLTGPTGSGKTTTLYAYLSKLNKEKVKIITVEDPVEYEIDGITQIQIKPDIGFTFAMALRSILRHDPDVMMVGEVRDLETAELAIRTALTGHLIFSTLHTNDAASGATRLLDIGIEPYLVASSVNAFISQRLVRMICPHCKEERKDKENLPREFQNMKVYQGRGCEKCRNIGYQGRTAINEILIVTPQLQELILNKASAIQIKQGAQKYGFKTLKEVGIEKVKAGLTTFEEIIRVVELG